MLTVESMIILPEVPPDLRDRPVAGWAQPLRIDTYDVEPPDRYPAYLDRRVYQGSSGRIYPLPFYERVSTRKEPRQWQAIHLENAYVRLVVLPELGGRIHIGLDKTNGYDFFYRNNVIKPALVGVTGPWISGGVEFNWPQHHRPGTYLPVATTIEEGEDGSVTVWCSDLDPFHRLRGTHGIRLRPDSSVVELAVRLTNRTDEPQTFLWWANVAARVGDDYQSFFPTDVHVVADHAKRAVTSFPASHGEYYGIDYPARVDDDHPDADRIDWYRNIPVPTSYMCLGSQDDFFGGYDHAKGAGLVHWADHHIAPGKKQWTWGNAPFGWAWDRNLTDSDGPYVELMAGVFTDNQPDFTFIAPGETKTFSQFWYPIRETGTVQQANLDAAVHLDVTDGVAQIALAATRPLEGAVRVIAAGVEIEHRAVSLTPARSAALTVSLPPGTPAQQVRVELIEAGAVVLAWQPRPPATAELPAPATEPPLPGEVETLEELYLIGTHLAQYRHATRSPEPYWREALARTPNDVRCLTAIAALHHRRGQLEDAEAALRRAVAELTRWNPNPADGEPSYRLGLVLRDQGRLEEAYDALAKATWNDAWKRPAWLAMARIDLALGRMARADEITGRLVGIDPDHAQACALRVITLRRLGRAGEAELELARGTGLEPLDAWLTDLAGQVCAVDAATLIDVADEYTSCGELQAALRVLAAAEDVERTAPVEGMGNQLPLIAVRRADLLSRNRDAGHADAVRAALEIDRERCFPGRLRDALLLAELHAQHPSEANPAALLGHWLYANGRGSEAIACWSLAPDDPVCLRNRGVASFNVLTQPQAALECYEAALRLAPGDAKLWFERDQLARVMGEDLNQRRARLEARSAIIAERDDLTVTYAGLVTGTGAPHEALRVMTSRQFQPWEGGEGAALGAWEQANAALSQSCLARGDAAAAVGYARAALQPPHTLGEDRHPLANVAELELVLGDSLAAEGDHDAARSAWERAAAAEGDFLAMATQPFSPKSYASLVAMQRLGRCDEAELRARALADWARHLEVSPAVVDYFATSLPTLLLFHVDTQTEQQVQALLVQAQAAAVLGETARSQELARRVLELDPTQTFPLGLLRQVTSRSIHQ